MRGCKAILNFPLELAHSSDNVATNSVGINKRRTEAEERSDAETKKVKREETVENVNVEAEVKRLTPSTWTGMNPLTPSSWTAFWDFDDNGDSKSHVVFDGSLISPLSPHPAVGYSPLMVL